MPRTSKKQSKEKSAMNNTLFQKSTFGASVGAVITMALYLLFVPPSFLEYLYLLAGIPYLLTPFIGFILGFAITHFLKFSTTIPIWLCVLVIFLSFFFLPFIANILVTKSLTNIAHTIPTYPERELLGVDNQQEFWYDGFAKLFILYKGELSIEKQEEDYKGSLAFYSEELPKLGWEQQAVDRFSKHGHTIVVHYSPGTFGPNAGALYLAISSHNKSVISIIFDQFKFANTY